MAETLFERYLDQLGKPLQYAMRNNFAQLPKLKGFEPYVRHQIRILEEFQMLPAAWLPLMQELSQAVESFEALSLAQKQQRMRHVHTLIDQMRDAVTQGAAASTPAPAAEPVSAEEPGRTPTPLPPRHPALPDAGNWPATPGRSETSSEPFQQSVQYLRGVGPKRAAFLAKLNLRTVNDLLWYLPTRYEDRRRLTPLGMLQVGQRQTF